MPVVARIRNYFHDAQTIETLREEKRNRDRELVDLFQEIRHELPKKAEERAFDTMFTRIKELQEEEVAGYNAIQRIIEKYENTLCGSLAMGSAKAFGLCMAATGIMGAIVSAVELSLERFADQEDAEQNTITTCFTISAIFFAAMGVLGFLIQFYAQKAINKATKYRNLTWQERQELKVLIKYFREMKSLEQIKESEDEIKMKFQKLVEQSHDVPKHFENVTLFESTEELINFLYLSLPEDHEVRVKLEILEHYATEGALPEPPLPLPSIEEVSHASSLDDELEEPEIEIVPDKSDRRESLWDPNFLLKHVEEMITSGQTFEKGVLRGINEDNLYIPIKKKKEEGEPVRPDKKKEIRPEVKDLIMRKQALCDVWLELEQFPGIEHLRQGFTKIQIGDVTVPRYKVFRELPHQEYKRKSSVVDSLV